MKRIKVIDSHTGGEPTRIIVAGGPELGSGPVADRLALFRDQFDEIRSAVVNEPRGSEVLVGGLICEPSDDSYSSGVIYFNIAGFLGMCGHGTIGLMVTLKHMGRIQSGVHRLETPVGLVVAEIDDQNMVSLQNVPSYRYRADVSIDVPGNGTVTGDVAWGGNWFFLVKNLKVDLDFNRVRDLTQLTILIRDTLAKSGVTGEKGEYVDHVELFGPASKPTSQSKNFVLCPGGAYDRSPCGTGTSAKLACLAADGKLAPGEVWRQESIVGSVFTCSYENGEGDQIIPTIRGTAYISGEAELILDPNDPFCMGIR